MQSISQPLRVSFRCASHMAALRMAAAALATAPHITRVLGLRTGKRSRMHSGYSHSRLTCTAV